MTTRVRTPPRRRAEPNRADRLLDVLPREADVVDVSCGWGDAAAFFRRLGCRYVGVDRSSRRIGRLRAQAQAWTGQVRFELGEPGNLPLPDASCDVVVARHVVSRLVEPHRALDEWVRVLRPGGLVVILESFPADPGGGRIRRWLTRGSLPRLLLPSPLPRAAAAPFRRGLRPDEARVYLALAPLVEAGVETLDCVRGGYAAYGRKPKTAPAVPGVSPQRYDPWV